MTQIPIDQIRQAIHALNGGQMMVMRDQLPENPKVAVEAEGETRAYRKMLRVLYEIEESGHLPDRLVGEDADAYRNVSKSAQESDRILNKQQEEINPDRGVE